MIAARIAIAMSVLFAPLASAQEYAGTDPATCAALNTDGVEVVPYEVQPGDSCVRVAVRQFGDRAHVELLHVYNPAMGPPPHHLRPGTHLCLPRRPPARGTLPAAHITALRQRVNARPPQAPEWSQAALGQRLHEGERVEVRERAFAELTFRDTSVVTLRGDTLVVVYGEEGVREIASRAELERGTLRTRLGELREGNRLALATPTARVAFASGDAVTSVDPEQTTRVSNHAGNAAVVEAPAGGRVFVAPGMGSSVQRGARPAPPRPLPDAPVWERSLPPRHLGVPQLTTVRGAWSPVADARIYRVEIARTPSGRDLVAAVEVPSDVSRFEIHRLPPGHYYARVSTIDGELFESRPSDAYAFEIVLGRLDAPGEHVPAAGFDYGDASEEPRPLVVLPGARFTPPAGTWCDGVGEDGAIALREPGPASFACRDANGRLLGAVDVSVASFALRVASAERDAVLVDRGTEATIAIELDSSLEIPRDARLFGSEGFEVIEQTREGRALRVRVRVARDAPERGALSMAIGEDTTAIAALDIDVRNPGSIGGAPEPLSSEAEPLLPQAFGLVPWPSVAGVRDLRRAGVGIAIAGAIASGEMETRGRGAVDVRVGLLDRQLQLEVAMAGDFQSAWSRTSQRGSGDVYAAAAYAPRFDSLALSFELAAFFPTTASEGGLEVVRLLPSVHAALTILPQLFFRARLGAFADLDGSGNAAFVSAYALDARIAGPLFAGVEIALTAGQEDGELLLVPAPGLSLGIVAGPLVLTTTARFGIGDSATRALGSWAITLGAEWTGVFASELSLREAP